MNKKIAIIGGCTFDITSKIQVNSSEVHMKDSNPGVITTSIGGVARNVAQNLKQLGLDVSFLTAFSKDEFGQLMKENCEKEGIDISHAILTYDYNQSIYLSINDSQGDLIIGSSDMNILNLINIDYLKANIDFLNESDYVYFDTNLKEDELIYLFSNVSKPIFMDGVSITKATKIKNLIEQNQCLNIYCLKLNKFEAEAIYGYELKEEEDYNNLAQKLTRRGVENLCITLGSEGAFFASKVGPYFQAIQMEAPKGIHIVNASGAGDAFLAGIIYGISEDEDNECIINYGLAAAKITLEEETPVSKKLDEEHLEKAFIQISKNQ